MASPGHKEDTKRTQRGGEMTQINTGGRRRGEIVKCGAYVIHQVIKNKADLSSNN